MTQLLSLFDAAAERDAALEQVAEHAGDEWLDYAKAFLADYARRNEYVFAPELWNAGLTRPPNDMRALGAVFMWARRSGLLAATGTTRPRPSGHCTQAPLWRSTIYRGDQ